MAVGSGCFWIYFGTLDEGYLIGFAIFDDGAGFVTLVFVIIGCLHSSI